MVSGSYIRCFGDIECVLFFSKCVSVTDVSTSERENIVCFFIPPVFLYVLASNSYVRDDDVLREKCLKRNMLVGNVIWLKEFRTCLQDVRTLTLFWFGVLQSLAGTAHSAKEGKYFRIANVFLKCCNYGKI